MSLHIMKKFCDFFTLRPSDLITNLTYVLLDNSCPCLLLNLKLKNREYLYFMYFYVFIG